MIIMMLQAEYIEIYKDVILAIVGFQVAKLIVFSFNTLIFYAKNNITHQGYLSKTISKAT